MKRWLRDLFLALKQSSKLTIISVLCILTGIILFLISAAIASHVTGYLHSMMMFAFSGSLALLSLSFLGFAFLTGYNREFALFYVLAIPVSILFLSLSAASIVSYMKAYDSFDFFVLGLYFCIALSAMAMRNLGILVRMILYKKERRNMWLRICIIVLCSLLIPIVLIFAILSALGGGFGDSTRQYLDGINRAGEDSEMVFSEMKAFPSMPAGFVTIFADYPPVDGLNMYPIEGTEIITEIYFENGKLLQEDIISRRNGMNGTAAYTYICEEKQTIVVLTNSHVIPLCSETYLFGKIKSAILDIQKKASWSEQDDSDFWGKYGILPPEKETDPSLGRFIFNETRDPDSSFSSVDKTWSARLVGSLYEESTKDFPDTMVDIYYPVSPEGNRVPRETLPEGVWTVYSLPCRYLWRTEEYMERERELIKGDLSYLLNHWRNASDIR